MKILVCNAGSTSLKFKLYKFPNEDVLFKGKVERIGDDKSIFSVENIVTSYKYVDERTPIGSYEEGINKFLSFLLGENGVLKHIDEVDAVGFKTVLAKGYLGVHIITDEVIKGLEDFIDVAPVHNGSYLKAIRLFKKILPNTTLVGVFETAFHKDISKEKYIYSIPYEWYEKYGVRKYGYHGASHSYTASVLEKEFGKNKKVISLHLGGSSSACAILNGKSIDTSFGFSLQTGIYHANRSGDFDDFIIPFMYNKGLSVDEISTQLIKNGGLKGISGISGDMRDLTEEYYKGNDRAKLAIDCFIYSIEKYIGLFYIELGGLDILSFTAGIGESSYLVRKLLCEKLSIFGVEICDEFNKDPKLNNNIISTTNSKVIVKIINADEEIVVATKTYLEIIKEK